MDDEVLDNLFTSVLPKFAKLSEMGMLLPDDFIGVTDEKDGCSMQAYEKAPASRCGIQRRPKIPR